MYSDFDWSEELKRSKLDANRGETEINVKLQLFINGDKKASVTCK
jgi:hypothetical protein